MPPVNLVQTARYATLVFNAVRQLRTESYGMILEEQLMKVFRPTEYVLFAADELDAGKEDSYEKLDKELDRRVVVDSSLLVPKKNSFLLVFYETAKELTEERLKNIIALFNQMKTSYANTTGLLCVDKTDDGKAAMDNTMRAATKLENVDGMSMLLCNTQKLTSCVGNVRALVRYIHCLSRENPLGTTLNADREKPAPATNKNSALQKRIAYVTMSEFDVQGYAKISERLTKIHNELNKSDSFPQDELNRNFNEIVAEEEKHFKNFANLTSAQVPVPQGALDKKWFCRNHETPNLKLRQLEKTLEYTFKKGVWEVYLKGLQERAPKLCSKLIEGIAVGDQLGVKDGYQKISLNEGKANWTCEQLKPVCRMDVLQDQIQGRLDGARDAYSKGVAGEVRKALEEKLGQVLTEKSIEEKRQRLAAEKSKLEAQMYNDVTDAQSYWGNIGTIMEHLSTLQLTNWDKEESYVLISDDTSKNWATYAPYARLNNSSVTTPYNCDKLNHQNHQEFQVLHVTYFTHGWLDISKEKMFNLEEMDE